MKPSAELMAVARRVVWFKPPDEVLADKTLFLAHVMTYGTVEDVLTARKHFSAGEFRAALENAPSGVFDARSWAYWNTVLDRVPVPAMPQRRIS